MARVRRRWVKWSLWAAVGLFLVWFVAAFVVVAMPRSDRPRRVDAILVLGPPNVQNRFNDAVRLARQGYATNLVVSLGDDFHYQPANDLCQNPQPNLRVFCFHPTPDTTQGEAREIAKLAAEHHWQSVMVVTSRYHISRARLIIRRCFSGQLVMVESHGAISPFIWAYQFAEQTGGFVKAFVTNRSC